MPSRLQLLADRIAALILPRDRRRERRARNSIPQQKRLALVIQPSHLGGVLLQQRRASQLDRAQDVERVLFDPRLANNIGVHRRGVGRQHLAGAIHDQRLSLAGALVDRQDVIIHRSVPSRQEDKEIGDQEQTIYQHVSRSPCLLVSQSRIAHAAACRPAAAPNAAASFASISPYAALPATNTPGNSAAPASIGGSQASSGVASTSRSHSSGRPSASTAAVTRGQPSIAATCDTCATMMAPARSSSCAVTSAQRPAPAITTRRPGGCPVAASSRRAAPAVRTPAGRVPGTSRLPRVCSRPPVASTSAVVLARDTPVGLSRRSSSPPRRPSAAVR